MKTRIKAFILALALSLALPLSIWAESFPVTNEGTTGGSITGTVTANAGTNLNTSALLTTAAHDAALGTAGSADAQVRTVQGVASMTPLVVNPSTVTTTQQSLTLTSGDDSADGTDAAVSGMGVVGIHVKVGASLTGTAEIVVQVSADGGSTFRSAPYWDLDNLTQNVATPITLASNQEDRFLVDVRGMTHLRLKLDDTSGDVATVTVTSFAESGVGRSLTENTVYQLNDTFTVQSSLAQLIVVERDDVLSSGAGTTGDNRLTTLKTDNFGALWSALTADDGARIPADSTAGLKIDLGSDNDVVATAGLLHGNSPTTLIDTFSLFDGSVETQIATTNLGASKAYAITGTGRIVKVCIIVSLGTPFAEDMSIIFFDTDPSITIEDASLTLAQAQNVQAIISLSGSDFRDNFATAKVNCQDVNEHYDSISHIVVASEGATTYDDEDIEIRLWHKRDS